MKAFLVKKTMKDGSVEGVVFTDKQDAKDALRGDCNTGATLAVAWQAAIKYKEIADKYKTLDIEACKE